MTKPDKIQTANAVIVLCASDDGKAMIKRAIKAAEEVIADRLADARAAGRSAYNDDLFEQVTQIFVDELEGQAEKLLESFTGKALTDRVRLPDGSVIPRACGECD